MKKHILSFILVMCLICTLVPMTASAAEIVHSGKIGSNISWTLDSDGLLTISGSGKMSPCDMESQIPWFPYIEDITAAVVEDGITSIGPYCFNKCYWMETVSLPDSVTAIDPHAFEWCRSLTRITLPENLELINTLAFCNCDGLETIEFNDKLTYIGISAFDMCRSLTDITLPASLEKIDSYAFRSCDNLSSVTFLGDAPEFRGSVFSGSGYLMGITCYYPANNSTWTADVMKNYGTSNTWVPCHASGDAAIPGDLNGDNCVDSHDVAALLWFTLFPENYEITGHGDFTGDRIVDDMDVAYLLWHTLFPESYPLILVFNKTV